MMDMLSYIRKNLPMDLDWPRLLEAKAELLLEVEKEQIINLIRFLRTNDKMGKSVDDLYNEFYN
ncbi:hypothetical protein UFOVP153_32 [uncultured Caudovirales phage]|uniref:Uncharacterized protein n=1 Tax=uncultured Caudovirales phage TaxID=2100421 RepID=A0A6J7WC44_9CAUD|nr:hypothetical protein UFOVP69_26 [uncultured Caudovirales phage]CAB5170646.1 hypothetical protein UFOVP153_32 [uncultured Caudovirales phage]